MTHGRHIPIEWLEPRPYPFPKDQTVAGAIKGAILALPPGDQMICLSSYDLVKVSYRTAQSYGLKIRSKKMLDGSGWAIWRVR